MARIRSIKPEFWDSPDTIRASLRARLLYIAMWNWADDYGIGDGNLGRLINFAFPGDNIPAADFPTLAAEVSDAFAVTFYTHRGRPYYAIPAWEKHQRTEKKARQLIPFPEDAESASDQGRESSDSSVGTSAAVVGSTVPGTRGTGEQGEQGEQSSNDGRKRPPKRQASRIPDDFQVTDAMRDWAAENVPAIDIEAETPNFVDHWHASATATARKLDWVAAWRTWMRNAASRRQSPPPRSLPARPSKDARAIETLRMGAAVQAAREQRGDHTALDGLFTPKALPA